MNGEKLQLTFFIIVFIAIGVLVLLIFYPFLNVLAISAVLAVVFQPLYERVLNLVRGRVSIASCIVVLVVAMVVISILAFVGSNIFVESRNLYFELAGGNTNYIDVIEGAVMGPIQNFFPNISIDIKSYVDDAVGLVGSYAGAFLTGTAVTLFNLFLGIIGFYYFLKDGDKFKKIIINISPLKDEFDRYIFEKLKISINAVVRGTLLVAIIQGLLTGLGMAIFGVPNATLWGTVAVLSAVVPGLGTAIVIIPAVIYLVLIGVMWKAVSLAIWGIFMVGLIDNLLAPFLYSKGTNIHPMFILFSVLGGIALFGPIGFLFGPLVLSLLYVLLHVYRVIVLKTETEEALLK